MKKIPLTQGKFALVDDEDFEWLSQWKWGLSNKYAARNTDKAYMHRLVNKTQKGKDTDHINGDKLDNRRSNLRSARRAENNANTKLKKNNTSGFKGVSFDKSRGLWSVKIMVDRKTLNLGRFADKLEAASAYRDASVRYFGEFAKTNIHA